MEDHFKEEMEIEKGRVKVTKVEARKNEVQVSYTRTLSLKVF